MNNTATFRTDKYYVQTKRGQFVSQKVMPLWLWLFYRIQFWRFKKYKNLNVLRERKLDCWIKE